MNLVAANFYSLVLVETEVEAANWHLHLRTLEMSLLAFLLAQGGKEI